jgi:exosortase H (IPTLxxWG-CTERM-specific)
MGLFYACEMTPFFMDEVFPRYLDVNARVSGIMLNALSHEVTVKGRSIASSRFSVDIRHGCDAIYPSALLLSAVLASPVSFRMKIPGMVAGVVLLMAMNLVRIVSLFYAGVYFPGVFQAMHLEIWPFIFILLALLFWLMWARWAAANKALSRDAFA